jgi:hypothetical protein
MHRTSRIKISHFKKQNKKKNQDKYAMRKKKGKKGRKNCNFAFGYGAKLKISSNQ